MAFLATSAAGLQAQLDLLEQYCAERGLPVNLDKAWVMARRRRASGHGQGRVPKVCCLAFAF